MDPHLAGIGGTRVSWEEAPAPLQRSIEDHLGDTVGRAESQAHGFSPALASRLFLADGRRAFVKAIGPDEESGAPGGQDFYLREARIAADLPKDVPAPRLIDSWTADRWVVLLFDDIPGRHPALPWNEGDFTRVLGAMALLEDVLTPSPIPARKAGIPGNENYWTYLTEAPALLERLTDLDPWVHTNIDQLAEIASQAERSCIGTTLLHSDIRADNILLTEDRVVFVDWPHASIGAAWIDLLFFLPQRGHAGVSRSPGRVLEPSSGQ